MYNNKVVPQLKENHFSKIVILFFVGRKVFCLILKTKADSVNTIFFYSLPQNFFMFTNLKMRGEVSTVEDVTRGTMVTAKRKMTMDFIVVAVTGCW